MTLSLLNPSTIWDRTLPKPASMLSDVALDAYTRRSSSLLQHHIDSNHFLTPAVDESGRRKTVPCIPVTQNSHVQIHATSDPVGRERMGSVITRKRALSTLSIENPSRSSSPINVNPPDTTIGYCLCQPEPKIPRPRNAFILYRQHQHNGVVARNPGLPNPDISKIIGEQWRKLPLTDKDEWKALAEQEKVRHSQQFPEYRYRPKRNGRYSTQYSNSEGSSASANTGETCSKCGGKMMNSQVPPLPSYTPVTPSATPIVSIPRPLKRTYAETQIQSLRNHSVAPVSANPYSNVVRYGYVQPQSQNYEHTIHYPLPPPPAPNIAATDSTEMKRRRFNNTSMYAPKRNVYTDGPIAYGARESVHKYHEPVHTTHTTSVPNRTPNSQLPQILKVHSNRLPPTPQHKRNPSLTLPPLKTASSPRPTTLPTPQAQKSGVENTIMSYPILTKIKTLASIAPSLASPGNSSPHAPVRGAVLAIEGMDRTSVLSMTECLAEQLERDGKFAVRIFEGPNPYETLDCNNEGRGIMTTEKYLSMITKWHKMSKELIRYITTGSEEDDEDREMYDADVQDSSEDSHHPRSPISAISPKTITQTADMSLHTPTQSSSPTQDDFKNPKTPIPQLSSRVPASALLQQQRQSSFSRVPDLHDKITTTSASEPHKSPKFEHQPFSPTNRLPVAIVPHYQLTTVDACSISVPITDNYDPITHWRWHATLWRGCVGADVTVVIKSSHEQTEEDTNASQSAEIRSSTTGQNSQGSQNNPQQPAPFGVEVRLQDCRTVIVRSSGSLTGVRGSDTNKSENENWDKVKRRVGFEVEEFLRR